MKKTLAISLFIGVILSHFSGVASADEDIRYQSTSDTPESSSFTALSKHPYDENKFELAYQAFVYAGHVNDAYAISLAAHAHDPNNVTWLARLAQTSLWSNHQNTALTAYYQLITAHHQMQYVDTAIALAENNMRYDILIKLYHYELTKSPNDIGLMQKLALSYNNQGKPTEAIAYLENQYQKTKASALLKTEAEILEQMGDAEGALHTLTQLKNREPHDETTLLAMASLDMNRGHYEQAYDTLSTQLHHPQSKSTAYWKQLAFSSWVIGKYTASAIAYEKLYQAKTIDEEGLRRLLLLQNDQINLHTLDIAKTAWHRFQSQYAFFSIVHLATQLNETPTLLALYKTPLPKPLLNNLKQEPGYWVGLAMLNHAFQKDSLARQLLLSIALTHPLSLDFQAMYFNFLIYQNNLDSHQPGPDYLLQAMAFYQRHLRDNPDWLDSYINAFNLVNEPSLALVVSEWARLTSPDNVNFLLQKSNALYELTDFKSAKLVRDHAFALISKRSPAEIFNDNELCSAYLDLVANRIDGNNNNAGRWAQALLKQNVTPLLAFSLESNNIDLADRLIHQLHDQPSWAVLRLAMIHHDKITEHRLVTTTAITLPPKDAIEAAVDAGDDALAQTLAYQALAKQPDDQRFALFKEVMLKHANKLVIQNEFEQFGNLQGLRQIMSGDTWMNGYELTPVLSYWNPHSNNTGNIASHPYEETIESITAKTTSHQDTVSLSAGFHQAYFSSYQALAKLEHVINHEQTLFAHLAYNQRSTLDTPMLIAGSQDEYALGFRQQLTPSDVFSTELEYDNYTLQDRTQLGSGRLLRLGLDHQIYFDYPDISLSWLTDIDRYLRRQVALSPSVQAIFPTSTQATVSAFIPDDFWQTGLTLNIGNSILTTYSAAWRPMLSAGLIYNETAGYGTDVSLGLVTRVFGRDQLKAYYNRSSITSGQSQTNFMVGLAYELYL